MKSVSSHGVGLRRACVSSKYVNQWGAKSAESPLDTLLALLAPPHLRVSRITRLYKQNRETPIEG
jgi:hypothetical protein